MKLSYLFPAILLFSLISSSCTQQTKSPPNILFIFTDDHCEQALSAYGSEIISTPNMDRIANEGMRFNRCYVTNSICGPSRAVIQTGMYSHMNGFLTNRDWRSADRPETSSGFRLPDGHHREMAPEIDTAGIWLFWCIEGSGTLQQSAYADSGSGR